MIEWARSIEPIEHAFVVDAEGLALVGTSTSMELMAASASLGGHWGALRQQFELAAESNLEITLGDSRRLCLISADTRWGSLSFGLVTRTRLSDRTLASATRRFESVIAREAQSL